VAISDQWSELLQIYFRRKSLYIIMIYGSLEEIRTHDPQIRSLVLRLWANQSTWFIQRLSRQRKLEVPSKMGE
jgi:hypothetical protein